MAPDPLTLHDVAAWRLQIDATTRRVAALAVRCEGLERAAAQAPATAGLIATIVAAGVAGVMSLLFRQP